MRRLSITLLVLILILAGLFAPRSFASRGELQGVRQIYLPIVYRLAGPGGPCAAIPTSFNAAVLPSNCVTRGTVVQLVASGLGPGELISCRVTRIGSRTSLPCPSSVANPSGRLAFQLDTSGLQLRLYIFDVDRRISAPSHVAYFVIVPE